jgi:hypothetical protein
VESIFNSPFPLLPPGSRIGQASAGDEVTGCIAIRSAVRAADLVEEMLFMGSFSKPQRASFDLNEKLIIFFLGFGEMRARDCIGAKTHAKGH